MGLRPTYMDETHLESMSFDGVDGECSLNRVGGRRGASDGIGKDIKEQTTWSFCSDTRSRLLANEYFGGLIGG